MSIAQRKTIGFLINSMSVVTEYESELVRGVHAAALAHDANLLVIAGEQLSVSSAGASWALPQNSIYALAGPQSLDALVIGYSAIGSRLEQGKMDAFVRAFSPLPLSIIGPARPGLRCGTGDNIQGIRDIVRHLVQEHGRTKFAFVRGIRGTDGDIRFEAFRQALKELGLACDEKLVYVGDWSRDSGKAAVSAFLSTALPFDALMAANDHMALGAASELMARGRWVPRDVAVTGFDDVEEAMAFNPPLTTVRQPVADLGRNAAELLFEQLEGKNPPMERRSPTQTIVRRSCGCELDSLRKGGMAAEEGGRGGIGEKIAEGFAKALLDLQSGGKGSDYLGFLEMEIAAAQERSESLDPWRRGLQALRSGLSRLPPELNAPAEELLSTGDLIVREIENRALHFKRVDLEKSERVLRRLIQAMGAAFELKQLDAVLAQDLPVVGIPGYFVARWDRGSQQAGNPELGCLSPLMYRLSHGPRMTVGELGAEFPAAEIYPKALRPKERWTAVASPLCFGQKILGLAVLERRAESGTPYEAVFRQLESSLEGADLLESSRRAEASEEERNRSVQALVRPMMENIDAMALVLKERLEGSKLIASQTAESSRRLERTDKLLGDIGKSIGKMADIIRIIDDISVNVHLISFNASVEAAHAGQYGKGFAVLAKEIKKMAASTQERSEEVGRQLESLIALIRSAQDSGRGSLESFHSQELSVQALARSLDEVSAGMLELNDKSKDILGLMGS